MTTHSITHPQLVSALVKPPVDIIASLTPHTADLWHGATGVAGETGELLEAILFPPVSGIDVVNVREELGDLFFYIEQIVQRSGITLDWDALHELARNNIISVDAIRHAASIAVHGSQVLDTVKKTALYNKTLDMELLTNQMSALAVSMLTLGLMFGLSRGECLNANIIKLSKRYASLSYSDKAAQERADKKSGEIWARKFFNGPQEPRTSDMADVAEASKRA